MAGLRDLLAASLVSNLWFSDSLEVSLSSKVLQKLELCPKPWNSSVCFISWIILRVLRTDPGAKWSGVRYAHERSRHLPFLLHGTWQLEASRAILHCPSVRMTYPECF